MPKSNDTVNRMIKVGLAGAGLSKFDMDIPLDDLVANLDQRYSRSLCREVKGTGND